MKKTTKYLSVLLTSLAALTGCKGSPITAEEAGVIIDDMIAKNAEYAAADVEDAYSFTAEVYMKETYEGESGEMDCVCKFDSENKVIYYLNDVSSGSETEKMEFYCGLKDDQLYYFDVVEKVYSVVEDTDAAKTAWEGMANYMKFPLTISSGILAQLKIAVETEAEGYKYYSNGEGNLVTEFTQEPQEGIEIEYTYTFKDYKITKEVIKGTAENASLESESTIKYSASVKLPSTSGYTKA